MYSVGLDKSVWEVRRNGVVVATFPMFGGEHGPRQYLGPHRDAEKPVFIVTKQFVKDGIQLLPGDEYFYVAGEGCWNYGY